MHQFLEAAAIALQAIWANKLRSLLTVLGNIVAVTSIIAVVSLVQGLNASVKDAIQSRVGADSFTRAARRHHPHRRGTAARGRATRASRSTTPRRIRALQRQHRLVMAEAGRRRPGQVPQPSRSTASRSRASRKEYISLPTTNIERGRLITPSEFDDGRPSTILGWDAADRLFGALDPLDKIITIDGVHFRSSASPRRRGRSSGNRRTSSR